MNHSATIVALMVAMISAMMTLALAES